MQNRLCTPLFIQHSPSLSIGTNIQLERKRRTMLGVQIPITLRNLISSATTPLISTYRKTYLVRIDLAILNSPVNGHVLRPRVINHPVNDGEGYVDALRSELARERLRQAALGKFAGCKGAAELFATQSGRRTGDDE